jgi:hypothetical protein
MILVSEVCRPAGHKNNLLSRKGENIFTKEEGRGNTVSDPYKDPLNAGKADRLTASGSCLLMMLRLLPPRLAGSCSSPLGLAAIGSILMNFNWFPG